MLPEDEAKLQTYGLELVEDADKNYKVQSAVGGVKFYNEDPLSISFSLNADDNKSLGSVIYTHSLTLHPNYDPEIDVVDAKPGVGSAADTIIFFWNDDPTDPVHNEAIINLSDANGDGTIFEQNIEMPKDGMSITKNGLIKNSYKLIYVSGENAQSGEYPITFIGYDRFGGSARRHILKLMSKYYKNKVILYEEDQFGGVVDGDKVQLLINNEIIFYKAGESIVTLEVEPSNSSWNTPWKDKKYVTFSFLTTIDDKVFVYGTENVGTHSGDYIRLAWHITESEGFSDIDNFPNSKGTVYFFTGNTWRYIAEYREKLNIPVDWDYIYPLKKDKTVRVKTAGNDTDY